MLKTPEQMVDASDRDARGDLEARRLRIIDLYESGLIDREEREKRLQDVTDRMSKIDAQTTVRAIPTLDWSWSPRTVNRVLRALFERIDLDPHTFQPVRFEWTVPEWRR